MTAPRWLQFGASVRGPSHEASNGVCQDAWTGWVEGTRLAMCLADGAGSAAHAEVGAAVAVAAAVESARTSLGGSAALEEVARGSVMAARGAVLAEATRRQLNPDQFAATMIVIVADGPRAAVSHVGDGGAVGARADGKLVLVSRPSRGEYVNETTFLTSSDWERDLRVSVTEDLTGLIGFTDGCQSACLVERPDYAPYERFFLPLLDLARTVDDPASAAADLERMLDGERFRRRSEDDKTLVVACLRASTEPPEPASASPPRES
jgi:hypothetical protein